MRLWVDAVCINQQDTQEQSSQVAMMAEIYSGARRTIVWLGEGRDEDDLQTSNLFQGLSDPTRVYHSMPHALIANGVGQCGRSSVKTSCPCGQPDVPTPKKDHRLRDWDEAQVEMRSGPFVEMLLGDRSLLELFASRSMALARFMMRRYWKRRWVLQETRRSPILSLHWNQYAIDSARFALFYDELEVILSVFKQLMQKSFANNVDLWPRIQGELVGPTPSDAGADLIKRFQLIQDLLAKPKEIFSMPKYAGVEPLYPDIPENALGRLLCQFSEMECSDPRDRPFSILGLIRVDWIRPDYNQSTVKIYTVIAKQFIQRGRADLVMININRFLPEDEISVNLPSWVPDLRERFNEPRPPPQEFDLKFDVDVNLEATFYFHGTSTHSQPDQDTTAA
jgi:hypothetical protein